MMKKLVAIVLSLMLLMTSAAMAENAFVLTYSDPQALFTYQGQDVKFDLNGLVLTLAAGVSGEIPSVGISIDAPEGNLLKGEMQFIGDKLVIDVDGLSNPLAMEAAGVGVADVAAQTLSTLDKGLISLPMIPPVEIPKLDVISLATMMGAEVKSEANGAQTATVSVPYEMVRMAMDMLASNKGLVPEAAQQYVGILFDLIDQMKASNSGFALEADFADDGTTATANLDVYLVENGVTADSPVGGLQCTFEQNQASLAIVAYQEGTVISLVNFDLTSVPAEAQVSLAINAMGMINATASVYRQDSLQVAAFELSAQGQKLSASLTYGDQDGKYLMDAIVDIAEQFTLQSISEVTRTEKRAEGIYSLNVSGEGDNPFSFAMNGDLVKAVEDYAFTDISDADNAIDMQSMTDEQKEALKAELSGVLEGLQNYLSNQMQTAA